VRIDGTYDNQLANPYTGDNPGGAALYLGVIVWSAGNDKTIGTNFNGSDDVIS